MMNVEDRATVPGYIYFRDNGMDYKFGITNNLVVRGRAYKTENPRDTVIDMFQVDTYAEAEIIEDEMRTAARAEDLCSFPNSAEWIIREEESKEFWSRYVLQYAKKTYQDWSFDEKHKSLTELLDRKQKHIADLENQIADLENRLYAVSKLDVEAREPEDPASNCNENERHGEWFYINGEWIHEDEESDPVVSKSSFSEESQMDGTDHDEIMITKITPEDQENAISRIYDPAVSLTQFAEYLLKNGFSAPLRKVLLSRKARMPKQVNKQRLRAYWGVFNSEHKRMAVFNYADKRAAETKAKELSSGARGNHFIQLVKEPI